ncbi:MAG: beta-galactosidase trimerization domain-containing protein [Anaerolineales bacterium]|nr:beta-galactosidase trimerization domain-containing protein [Anaerolineales bacterium]
MTAAAAGPAGWFDRPMRWAQLTLAENDPAAYDQAFWLDYFQRAHCDAACLSAGGVVAYYPTQVPLHHRSAWLGDRDLFGELVAACRRLNMVVVARTDSHALHQAAVDAHPDWVAVDAAGQPRRHWASPELWVACALGPYSLDFMTAVHREIMSRYQVDGIFTNRWDGSGLCYCEHCRRNFRAASGLDLPPAVDAQDERWRRYVPWYQERLFAVWRRWEAEIRAINPAARFIPNAGGGALSLLDMKTVGELADTLFADRQGRFGLMPPWASGKDAKEYRATLGRKPIVGIFSVGLEGPYRWKDSVQSDAETRIWVADGIANGLRPWFTKFAGTVSDRRWLKTVNDLYDWHYRAERYLRNEAPLARVGLVYSQQTAAFYGGAEAQARVEDHTLGMYQALIEARVPFEMVHDQLLDPEHLQPFKLLILPNIAVLSDAQCAQLRQYVQAGGSLLATYETALYDEAGRRRADFGLADLFGAHYRRARPGPLKNSYLRLERGAGPDAPALLAGLEDTDRIINGLYWLDVAPEPGGLPAPLTLIPAYPDLPMEMVYPRVSQTDVAAVHLRAFGQGRVAYFPWDIDRTFWEVLCVDHGQVLANTIRWALDEEGPVTVVGPGLVDVTAWRQRDSLTVHLVNLANPMLMKGPYRELLPLPEQRVQIRLPAGRQATRVQLLVSGQPPAVEQVAGALWVTVPAVLAHEVVAVDLDGPFA